MNRIRCFIGVCLSLPVTRKIAEEVERQRKARAGQKIAWVPPANLHVTLRFLGSIDEALIDGITLALKKLAPRHPPFEAVARGLGAFPDGNHPRVLWVGVEGDALPKLQREVEAAMVGLGFPREERAFHPHVTVGRVKEDAVPEWGAPIGEPSGARRDANPEASPRGLPESIDFGASTINEIVVYESRTHSSGAEYVARARVALGKGD